MIMQRSIACKFASWGNRYVVYNNEWSVTLPYGEIGFRTN